MKENQVKMNRREAIWCLCEIWTRLYKMELSNHKSEVDRDVTEDRILYLAKHLGILSEVEEEHNKP